jgi:hypothetical protein
MSKFSLLFKDCKQNWYHNICQQNQRTSSKIVKLKTKLFQYLGEERKKKKKKKTDEWDCMFL